MNSDIRVSTDLRNHPKVRTLAKNLNITRAQAVGHLVLLWSSAAIYKPDGVLSGLDPVDLAEFAGISEKKAVHFQTNLINLHFLDVNPATGEVSLHNWEIHQSYVIHAPEMPKHAPSIAHSISMSNALGVLRAMPPTLTLTLLLPTLTLTLLLPTLTLTLLLPTLTLTLLLPTSIIQK